MIRSGLSGKLLPIHLRPEDDELLSSWLVRLSVSHGMKPSLFSSAVCSEAHAWRVHDVDRTRSSALLSALSDKTATCLERVFNTTLTAYEGRLFETSLEHGTTAWIMPRGNLKHISQHKYFGLQYCPLCLSGDRHPYFRREWRLAFNVICTEHEIFMLDYCTKCGEAINFFMNTSRNCYVDSNQLTVCHKCGSDYRNINASFLQVSDSVEVNFHKYLLGVLRQGWATLSGHGTIHSLLFFEGLRHMAYALTRRNHSKENLLEQAVRYYGFEKLHIALYKWLPFQQLDIRTRRSVLLVTQRLLERWPKEFISFSKSNKLESSVWTRNCPSVPFWLWNVINLNLLGHSYTPSEQEINSILSYIDKSGQEPRSGELCKYLSPHYVHGSIQQRGQIKSIVRPKSLRRKAVRLVLQGHSQTQVAKLISVSIGTVYNWVKAYHASCSSGQKSKK